jgi:hypothetical protein
MKLHINQFSPSCYYFIPLKFRHLQVWSSLLNFVTCNFYGKLSTYQHVAPPPVGWQWRTITILADTLHTPSAHLWTGSTLVGTQVPTIQLSISFPISSCFQLPSCKRILHWVYKCMSCLLYSRLYVTTTVPFLIGLPLENYTARK